LKNIYNFIFKYSKSIISFLIIALILFSYYSTKLEIDASADTLLLNDDKDLIFQRTVAKRFSTSEIMVITYAPKDKLLSDKSLETLKNLHSSLSKVSLIQSVESILSVPLLLSPPREIQDLIGNTRTIETDDINKTLVKKEFLSNPLYAGSLVSKDFKTSTIILKLYKDKTYDTLVEQRNKLLKKARFSPLLPEESKILQKVKKEFKIHRDKQRESMSQGIRQIRNIIQAHKSEASLFLGGVSMISNDIVSFVKNDLLIYVDRFDPDIILVSAGYDLHESDPLAQLNVTTEGIRKIVRLILESKKEIPFLFFLEGGYDVNALGENVRVTLEEMLK